MDVFAVDVFWLTSLALPALLFVAADRFESRWVTLAIALIAVGVGGAFNFAYAIAAQSLTAKAPEDVNGAALAFAATFGWVMPIFIVATWAACRIVRRRLGPNDPFKPTPRRGAAQFWR